MRLLDLCGLRSPFAGVSDTVREFRPDVVGISLRNLGNCNYLCPESYLSDARRVVEAVRGAGERREIVLGGSAVSIAPEAIARSLGLPICGRWRG